MPFERPVPAGLNSTKEERKRKEEREKKGKAEEKKAFNSFHLAWGFKD